jgi:Ca2+-binding RTX toxin-like protein
MSGGSTPSGSGNPDVDGLLSGYVWSSPHLTFSFPTDGSYYGAGYESGSGQNTVGFAPLNAAQQAAVLSVLAQYAAVSNLQFTEITETADQHADLREAQSGAPFTADTYYPDVSLAYGEGGDTFYGNTHDWYQNPVVGGYGYDTFMHEIGLALGLKDDTTGTALPLPIDSVAYTVESYRSYAGAPPDHGYTIDTWSYPQSLMMYDIAAIQQLYGANYNTNSGDTIYSWDPSTGEEFINGVGQGAPGGNKIFLTIWDGGGTDTYDFSNYTTDLDIDLRPGAWSTVSVVQLADLDGAEHPGLHLAPGNIANALEYQNNPASLIENAIGGSGNDTIIGNQADNLLDGGAGNDKLVGLAGNDALVGGAGQNVLNGGAGNDILDGGGSDTAVYSGNRGSYRITRVDADTVQITDLRPGSPSGTDTVTGVQYFKFADGTYGISQLVSAPKVTGTTLEVPLATAIPLDAMFTVTNVYPGVSVEQFQFREIGNDADDDSGFVYVGGAAQAPSLTTGAADLAEASFQTASVPSTEKIQVRVFDGLVWSKWKTITIVAPEVLTPEISAANIVVQKNTDVAVGSLFTASVPFTDRPMTEYQIDDATGTAQSGYLVVSGIAQPNGEVVDVSADDLSQVILSSGFGANTLRVRAFDGQNWSDWKSFTVKAVDAAPIVTGASVTAAKGEAFTLSSLYTASDTDVGDTVTKIQVVDTTAAPDSGYLIVDGVARPANKVITLTADQIAEAGFQSASGTDTLRIRAFDGQLWSAWQTISVSAPINHVPIVSATDQVIAKNTIVAADTFFDVADQDGDAMVEYQLRDSSAGVQSGHFIVDGVVESANQVITVSADQLSAVLFQAGGGIDNLSIRAFDGVGWSAWTSLKVAGLEHAPTIVATDIAAPPEDLLGLSALASISDADSDPITKIQVLDANGSPASGHFVLDGHNLQAGQIATISAADFADLSFAVGTTSDTIKIRAFDGQSWSAWTTLHVAGSTTDHAGAASLAGPGPEGHVDDGQTITASVADPDGAIHGVSFQWQILDGDGVTWNDLADATSAQFTPGSAELGDQVRVAINYSDSFGAHTVASTAVTVTPILAIDGTASEGHTLTAAIADAAALSTVSYQWEQSLDGGETWNAIADATDPSFTPSYTDAGKLFEVVASYTANGGHSGTVTAVTAPIADVDQPGSVTLTGLNPDGVALEGQPITATVDDADGLDLNAVAFQWQVSGDGIAWSNVGQGEAGYSPTAADNGQQLRLVATYNDADNHSSVTATSATVPIYHGVSGTAGDDILRSTAENDWLTGGGGNDTFAFAFGSGRDVIADFVPHTGTGSGDTLDLSALNATDASLQDMIANHHIIDDAHGNAVISFDNGANTITLQHVQVSQLHASDFILH